MNRLAKKYRALELYRRELDMLIDVYNIPPTAFKEQRVNRRFELIDSKWYDVAQNTLDNDLVYHVVRRVDRVVDEIRDIRSMLSNRDDMPSFQDRVNRYVSKAYSKMRHLFCLNEGGLFNFNVHVGLKHTLPDITGENEFGFEISGLQHVWYRGRKITNYSVKVAMTPRNAQAIRDEWFCFKIKSKPQFVLNAEELSDHALNDQGAKVYRLNCFGLIDNEPQEYKYYLVQNEGLLNEEGHHIYAHGKDVNSAMSLLNRRIKSETIKRLDI